MRVRRAHWIAGATAACATLAPLLAAHYVTRRTDALAVRLGAAGGLPARIGAVDADLTGTIRLRDVAIGKVFAAETLEASVALRSLLSGQVSADEIRVAGPRIAISVDRDGDSDLARLVRRLAHAGPRRSAANGERKLRRIVVSSGTLTARIAGIGELSADQVELVPDAGGVRVVTGPLRVRGAGAGIHGELVLARSAAEVSLPHVRFGRVLGVGGTGSVVLGHHTVKLRDLAVGRLAHGGGLEASGFLDDGGVPRAVFAAVAAPTDTHGWLLSLRGEKLPLAPFADLAPRAFELAQARATGSLQVSRNRDGLRIESDATLWGLRVSHPTLAPQPVPLDGRIDIAITVGRPSIAIERAAFVGGDPSRVREPLALSLSGWLRRGSPVSGQLELSLATAPCMDLVGAVPVEIRGPLDGIVMTGTFGGRARLAIDLAAPTGQGVELTTDFANQCTVTNEPPAADVTSFEATTDHPLPDGTTMRVGKDQPSWFEMSRLPKYVKNAFVSAEDARFFDHKGFDLHQIGRSLEIDLRDGRLARGGSTISQQLVKNSFLTRRRSFDRKLQEVVLTWRLEARLAKLVILERSLNIIELGPKIYGLRAAAEFWFMRSPRELTLRQAAFLAALTSEPTSMTRRIQRTGGLDPESAQRVDVILRAMRRDGVIEKLELDAARATPMGFSAAALRHES